MLARVAFRCWIYASARSRLSAVGVEPTVEVPRRLLLALGLALAGALVALAFLLGRASVGGPALPVVATATRGEAPAPRTVEPEPEPDRPAAAAADQRMAATQPEAAAQAEAATQPEPAPPGAPAPTPSAATPENERSAVAGYFAALDAVERQAKVWSDPQELALQLMQQLVTGNNSGLDGLVASQRQARSRIAALVPPAACREHHTQVLQLMDESLVLLAGLGQALTAADSGVLDSFTAKARDLEARAKRVDAQGVELKRQFGL